MKPPAWQDRAARARSILPTLRPKPRARCRRLPAAGPRDPASFAQGMSMARALSFGGERRTDFRKRPRPRSDQAPSDHGMDQAVEHDFRKPGSASGIVLQALLFGGPLGAAMDAASRAVLMIAPRRNALSIRENACSNSIVSRVLAKHFDRSPTGGFFSNTSRRSITFEPDTEHLQSFLPGKIMTVILHCEQMRNAGMVSVGSIRLQTTRHLVLGKHAPARTGWVSPATSRRTGRTRQPLPRLWRQSDRSLLSSRRLARRAKKACLGGGRRTTVGEHPRPGFHELAGVVGKMLTVLSQHLEIAGRPIARDRHGIRNGAHAREFRRKFRR